MKPIFVAIEENHYVNLTLVTEIIDDEDEGTTFWFGEESSVSVLSFKEIIEMVNKERNIIPQESNMKPIFVAIEENHYVNLTLVTEIIDDEDEGTTFWFGGESSVFKVLSFKEIMEMVNKAIKES